MTKKKSKWETEEDEQEGWVHPSQDSTCRFAIDQLIRNHGWQILYRKKGKEPIWENSLGVRLPQSEVINLIPEEQIRIFEELELNYFCF